MDGVGGGRHGGGRHAEGKPRFEAYLDHEDVIREGNSGASGSAHVDSRRYVCARGMRYVTPYLTEQQTFLKLKYVDRPFLDVLSGMFQLNHKDKSEEALQRTRQFWAAEMAAGRVKCRRHKRSRDDVVGWESVAADQLVRKGDKIAILRHVHEQVVRADMPAVVHEDEDVVVVDKVAGVPTQDDVHGLNSMMSMVNQMYPGRNLHICHRLDRPVSGVLIFGKGGSSARRIMKDIQDHAVHKTYVARVCGRFPRPEGGEPITCSLPLQWSPEQRKAVVVTAHKGHAGAVGGASEVKNGDAGVERGGVGDAGTIGSGTDGEDKDGAGGSGADTDAPAGGETEAARAGSTQDVEKAGGHKGGSGSGGGGGGGSGRKLQVGKESVTVFRLLSYHSDTDTSLVMCCPMTGRRHQLRAHLGGLGHPIANDQVYGGDRAALGPHVYQDDDDHTLARMGNAHRMSWCPKCTWCAEVLQGTDELKTAPLVDMGIWLHSYRYHFIGPPTKTFQTKLPEFTEDFEFEIPPVPPGFCRPPGESRSIFGRKSKK